MGAFVRLTMIVIAAQQNAGVQGAVRVGVSQDVHMARDHVDPAFAGNTIRLKRQIAADEVNLRSRRVRRDDDNHLSSRLLWQVKFHSYRVRSDVKRLKVIAGSQFWSTCLKNYRYAEKVILAALNGEVGIADIQVEGCASGYFSAQLKTSGVALITFGELHMGSRLSSAVHGLALRN